MTFIITGTIAVLMNLARVSLTEQERLYAVNVSCFSLNERNRTTQISDLFMTTMTNAQTNETKVIVGSVLAPAGYFVSKFFIPMLSK